MGKLAKMGESGGIVGSRGLFFGSEVPKMDFPAIYSDVCRPLLYSFVPVNPYELVSLVIRKVLRATRLPKIFSSVIQGVVVPVVTFLAYFAAKNKTVHENGRILAVSFFGSLRIETLKFFRPHGLPVPLRKPYEVNRIDNGILISSKRDKSVGCIGRLNNWMAFYGTLLAHWSSLKDCCGSAVSI